MEIIGKHGKEGVATVYVGRNRGSDSHMVEFAESLQRPLPIEKKWVVIVSTLYGCPIGCLMCDAGISSYRGKLTAEEIFQQIDYVVEKRFPDKKIPTEKFKIQFARIGEPAFNPAVLDVLRELPKRYAAPGLMPCISTIAPRGCEEFFDELVKIKNEFYNRGNFQLQFSIHTTDPVIRNKIMPIKKWSFGEISSYGEKFHRKADRKITLNFAAIEGCPIDPAVVKENFNPKKFVLKFTPLNPTEKVKKEGLHSLIDPNNPNIDILFTKFNSYGFETILSIGDLEENNIGSNCGQILLVNNLEGNTGC